MKALSLAVSAILLCGCVTQSEIVSSRPQAQFMLSENYQAVYARLLRAMNRCMAVGFTLVPGSGTLQVDGQLYPDLGYGEIGTRMQGMIRVTYHHILVKRSPSGTEVVLTVENMTAGGKAKDTARLERWARGSTTCE